MDRDALRLILSARAGVLSSPLTVDTVSWSVVEILISSDWLTESVLIALLAMCYQSSGDINTDTHSTVPETPCNAPTFNSFACHASGYGNEYGGFTSWPVWKPLRL